MKNKTQNQEIIKEETKLTESEEYIVNQNNHIFNHSRHNSQIESEDQQAGEEQNQRFLTDEQQCCLAALIAVKELFDVG